MNERARYYSGSNAEMKWLVMREFDRPEGFPQGKTELRHLGQSRRSEDVRVTSALASWLGSLGRLGCLSMLQDVSRLHAEPSQRVDVRLSDRLDCFIRAKS